MRQTPLRRLGLGLALLLASAPAAGEAPPPPPEDRPATVEPSDYRAPNPLETPPGSRADQALWKRAMDDSNALTLSKSAAAKLQWRARQGNYEARLSERAKGQSGPDAERTRDLATRLKAAWNENYEISSSQWPVDPTRGCQYQAQLLESSMREAEGPARSAALVPARDGVNRCVELAESIIRKMSTSNAKLEKVLAEADAALPAAGK